VSVQHVTYRDPLSGEKRSCPAFDEYAGREVRCKRRYCPICGVVWARDWHRVNEVNLEHYGGAVVMVTITAPGEERLPWDEAHCAHRRKHKHRGPTGCRVQQRAAREWADTLPWRWAKLRSAARLATRRAARDPLTGELGQAPSLLERAYEPQKRGVPHLHVVLGYGTDAEKDAAHLFVGELKRLVGEYDFGFADGRGKRQRGHSRPVVERHGVQLRPMSGADAARYLANYITGRNPRKKASIRENIGDPTMPRSLIWLTPALTSPSTAERIELMRTRLGVPHGTGVTIRWLRKARHVYAAMRLLCPAPTWKSTSDAVLAVAAYLQAYEKRPPGDLRPALELARSHDRHVRAHFRWADYLDQLTGFAFELAGACLPAVETAAA
jgi:hypothetical protein